MRIAAVAVAVALALFAGLSSASQLSPVTMRVIAIEQLAEDTYKVELQRAGSEPSSTRSCTSAVLTVEYSWPWWRSGPAKSEHWQAIGFLLHAYQTKTEFQFGAVGVFESSECSATVKALSLSKGVVLAHF